MDRSGSQLPAYKRGLAKMVRDGVGMPCGRMGGIGDKLVAAQLETPPIEGIEGGPAVEEAREEGAALNVLQTLPDVASSSPTDGETSVEEALLIDFSGCDNVDMVRKAWAEFAHVPGMSKVDKRDGAISLIKRMAEEELSGPTLVEARKALEKGKRGKRPRSSDLAVGGPVQAVDGEGGGGEGCGMGDGPPVKTRKNRGGDEEID